MSVERIVGIDFGTSTSVIRVKRYKDGQPVDDRLSKIDVVFGNGIPMVPTLIQKTSKGTYFGYEAEIQKERGETLYQNFKIDLESADSGKKAEARELTEEFFSYLGKVYSAQNEGGFLGEPTDTERTIVSYPVKWSEDTKKFMINAAKKAGFKNVEGMDEAQAAIHAVTVQYENLLTNNNIFKNNVPCNILLIDMGAGTTDLVMCRHTPGKNPKTEILCTWPLRGDILFGGREVDEKLIEYVKGLMEDDDPSTEKIIQKVGIKEFKSWKETVVSPALQRGETVETFSKVDDIADLMDIEMDSYGINRSVFESYLAGYLNKLPQLINGCIKQSGLKNSNIDLVILTGGHSQWYFVENMLKNTSVVDLPKIQNDSKRILKITRPQETVALGMVFKPLSIEIKEERTSGSATQDSTSGTTPYRMYIEEVFEVTNSGYAICGLGKGGVLKIGDRIEILNGSTPVASAIVSGIEMYKKTLTEAYDNQSVGIIVKFYNGISPDRWTGLNLVSGATSDDSVTQSYNHNQSGKNNKESGVKGDKGNMLHLVKMFPRNESIEKIKRYYSTHASRLTAFTDDGDIYVVRADGGVASYNDKSNIRSIVSKWRNINSLSVVSSKYPIASDDEGNVFVSFDKNQNSELADALFFWKNIAIIKGGYGHILGLRKDGTGISACGFGGPAKTCAIVSNWINIRTISNCSGDDAFGLKSDGTIVQVKPGDYALFTQRDLEEINASRVLVGLTSTGRVRAIGRNGYTSQYDVSQWNNIISVTPFADFVVGVTAQGRVVCSDKKYGVNFNEWNNIIAVAADTRWNSGNIIGITNDGRVLRKQYNIKTSIWSGEIKYMTLVDSSLLFDNIF